MREGRGRVVADFCHNVDMGPCRHEQSSPSGHVESRYTGLRDGWNIRGVSRARDSCGREPTYRAALHLWKHGGHVTEINIQPTRDKVIENRPAATIGDVGHLDADHPIEQCAAKMLRRPRAR